MQENLTTLPPIEGDNIGDSSACALACASQDEAGAALLEGYAHQLSGLSELLVKDFKQASPSARLKIANINLKVVGEIRKLTTSASLLRNRSKPKIKDVFEW